MYVVVDKVTLEPSADAPERIKIEGSFVRLLEDTRRYEYGKPVEGYVYLSLDAAKAKESKEEWAKWQKAAGTGKAVAVGSCREAGSFLTVKIRKPGERVDKPDATYTPEYLGRSAARTRTATWRGNPRSPICWPSPRRGRRPSRPTGVSSIALDCAWRTTGPGEASVLSSDSGTACNIRPNRRANTRLMPACPLYFSSHFACASMPELARVAARGQ